MFLDYYLRIKIKRSHMDILEITRKQDPLYPTFEQIYTASFPLFEAGYGDQCVVAKETRWYVYSF